MAEFKYVGDLSYEKVLAALELRNRKAQNNFYYFYTQINQKIKRGWFQKDVCDHLQIFYDDLVDGLRPKLVIQSPPQFGKSSMAVNFIAWMLGKNPDMKTIYASFSERLGIRANLQLQRMFANPIYQSIFPDTRIPDRNVTNSSQKLRNREIIELVDSEGYFRNTTVRGSITGESLDCLTGDTLITTNKGLIPIRDLFVGDKVLSIDIDTKELSYQPITNHIEKFSNDIIGVFTDSDDSVVCTKDHLFYVGGTWKQANQLCEGDRFLFYDANTKSIVERIFWFKSNVIEGEYVYDITVSNNHNFFANGLLVHNCGIIDDPLKGRAEANSIATRNATWDWFTDDFFTRFSEDAGMVTVLTRWHVDDPIGRLIESDPYVKVISYPAIATEDEEHRKKGESLFPEHKSIDFLLERKKVMAAPSWESLYQQSPFVADGELFKIAHFKYYKVLPKLTSINLYADTAQKTKEQNDYSVIQAWGLSYDNRLYLLDQLRGKYEAPDLIVQSRAFYNKILEKYGSVYAFKVEDKVSGTGLIQTLQREGLPIIGIQRHIDKVTRAIDVLPLIESGNVYLPEGATFLSDFLTELQQFPNSVHDDQVDPLVDAISDKLSGEIFDYGSLL